jgi:hypothetical protein
MEDKDGVCVPTEFKKVVVPHTERPRLQETQHPNISDIRGEDKGFNFNRDILLDSATFDEEDNEDYIQNDNNFCEGIHWEPLLDVTTDVIGLLQHGELVNDLVKGSLVGVDPTEPLFASSSYSARDFCRYVLAMKQSTSK